MTAGEEVEARLERAFGAVVPLILEEWPALDRAAIEATRGDLPALVALVAERTERTKVAVRRQLGELVTIAEAAARKNGSAAAAQVDEWVAAARRLESFAADEARRVQKSLLPQAEARLRQSPWASVLIAFAIGIILGLWLNGRRGR